MTKIFLIILQLNGSIDMVPMPSSATCTLAKVAINSFAPQDPAMRCVAISDTGIALLP